MTWYVTPRYRKQGGYVYGPMDNDIAGELAKNLTEQTGMQHSVCNFDPRTIER